MSWMKVGDDAATFPPLLDVAAVPDADERTLNEVAGFVFRCACQSAGHETDYVISRGTAAMVGGARTDELVRLCLEARLIEESRDPAGRSCWKVVENADFIHLVTRAEAAWQREQRNNTRDPSLVVPLLLRDGLLCRFCGTATQRKGRRSARTFTVHHLDPGKPARGLDDAVVACLGCNSALRDDPDGEWARDHPLLPPPRVPFLNAEAADYATRHGYPTKPTDVDDPAVAGLMAKHPKVEKSREKSTSPPVSQVDRISSAGSGRDGFRDGSVRSGSGPDGTARGGSGREPPKRRSQDRPAGGGSDAGTARGRRRRGKRGGRKRTGKDSQ